MGLSGIYIIQILLLLCSSALANTAGDDFGLRLRFVATVPAFQRAIKDGVKHIVLTEHLIATSAQQEIEGMGESLDSAIGNVQPGTKSIVGNCRKPLRDTPGLETITLKEQNYPGACIILVEEDFMELPLRQGRGATELWLHNFYIMTQAPLTGNPNASATTILHKDGHLYITNTVFQGRDYWNRAIDLSSADGGSPLLYVGDSKFVNFRRDHAAAIRGNPNTAITVQSTSFKRLTITPLQKPDEDPIKWARVFGAAIGLFENALLWLVDVSYETMVVLGEPAGSKVFTFESVPMEGTPGGNIYAQPPLSVWDYALNITVPSKPSDSRPNRFLTAGSILEGIQQEQATLAGQGSGVPVPPSDEPPAGDRGTPAADGSAGSGAAAGAEPITSLGDGGNDDVPVFVWVVIALVVAAFALVVIMILVARKKRNTRRSAARAEQLESMPTKEPARPPSGPQQVYPSLRAPSGSSTQSAPRIMSRNGAIRSTDSRGSGHHSDPSAPSLPPPPPPPQWGPPGYPKGASQVLPNQQRESAQMRPQSSMGSGFSSQNGPAWNATGAQSASGSADSPAWGKFQFPPGSGASHHGSHHTNPDHRPSSQGGGSVRQTFGTMTFDATYHAQGLPQPDRPGSILNREQLKMALDQAAEYREMFLGRFELLGEAQRREGGQGVVQFARVRGTGEGVAIKFFLNRNAFDCEEGLYVKKAFRGLMPAITLIENNDAGVAVTREGWRYPPFIVVERGESLDEWQLRIQPDFPTIVQMLIHMTERVRTLHEQGIVHRDLKPGNVLWRPVEHSWTLIDFGCAAEIGFPARLTFSPVYAPPETLQAVHGGATTIIADAAVDIWAIGVITFELVTQKRAFHWLEWKKDDVMHAALGKRPYDWETAVGTFKKIPALRVLSKVVHACLEREAGKRPTATGLLKMLNALYDSQTSVATNSNMGSMVT